MSRSWYDVAQICLNGHIINASTQKYPQHNKKYCDKCGEKTITRCPNCNAVIQGEYHVEGIAAFGGELSPPPSFCPNCGNPYPWTEKKIKTAHQMTKELSNLTSEEKELLEKSIDNIIKETPETRLAVTRIKKLLPKVGKEAGNMLRDLVVDIASESAKKMLSG